MQITFNIPDLAGLTEKEAKIVFAGKLYELGKLSLGQAAELAGYSKKTYMEIMGDYGINYISYPVSDLNDDLTNA